MNMVQVTYTRLSLEQLEGRCLCSYSITALGFLPNGTYTVATALNSDATAVVGYGDTVIQGATSIHAFLYNGTGISDLGTLRSDNSGNSWAYAVNSHGDIAGDSIEAVGNFVHAFRRRSSTGQMVDLGNLRISSNGDGESHGTGINDAADVAGKSTGGQASFDAFWYKNQDSTMYDLEVDHSFSYANAIDNSNPPVIVGAQEGFLCDTQPFRHAFSWTGTSSEKEIGTLSPGHESHAYAINADGRVCGDSSIAQACDLGSPPPHAFVATLNGGTYSFTQLDLNASWISISRAFGMNSGTSYKIVGQWGGPSDGGFTDGFLWSSDGSMAKLGDLLAPGSGWSHLLAYGINASGKIVGQGTYTDAGGNISHRAFLMTPGTGPSAPGHDKTPPPPDSTSIAAAAPAGAPASSCGCHGGHANLAAPGVGGPVAFRSCD
jgi:probable HAF family extracellular repeat protein